MHKRNVLILALDGCSKHLIKNLGLFQSDFGKDFKIKTIDADLLGRGWPEWITGESSFDISALYNKPTNSPNFNFTSSYGHGDYEKQNLDTIWSKLNSSGLSVGLFGLPTTYPAPELNGFCISGSGAGFDQSAGMPTNAVYPQTLGSKLLEFGGLTPEIRIANGQFTKKSDYLKLEAKGFNERAILFSKLAKHYKTDVNIFFDKYLAHLAWIYMREINNSEPHTIVSDPVLARHVAMFEKSIQTIYDRLKPEAIILISDHGVQERVYSVNINSLLTDHRFLHKVKAVERLGYYGKNSIKRILPNKIVSVVKYKKNAKKASGRPVGKGIYSNSTSQAFAARYIPGIFINTNKYGGPVLSGDVPRLKSKIVEIINTDLELRDIGISVADHGLSAKMIKYFGEDFIPLTEPAGVFFEETGPLVRFNRYLAMKSDRVPKGSSMLTGIKQRDAVFGLKCDNKNTNRDFDKSSVEDLPATHFNTIKLIKQLLEVS